jgi:hypothetical protein
VIINKKDYVKFFFKNGLEIEGVVEEWEPNGEILKLENNQGFVIINNTADNVLAIQVIPYKKSLPELKQDFEQVINAPSDEQRLNTLAKLKQELNKVERQNFSEKIVSHNITGGTGFVKYGDQFSALKSLKQYTEQQNSGETE